MAWISKKNRNRHLCTLAVSGKINKHFRSFLFVHLTNSNFTLPNTTKSPVPIFQKPNQIQIFIFSNTWCINVSWHIINIYRKLSNWIWGPLQNISVQKPRQQCKAVIKFILKLLSLFLKWLIFFRFPFSVFYNK